MKIKIIFAWYDFWIGLFYDQKKKWLYIFPMPMIGILIKLSNAINVHELMCPKCGGYKTAHHNYVKKRVCIDCRYSWRTNI